MAKTYVMIQRHWSVSLLPQTFHISRIIYPLICSYQKSKPHYIMCFTWLVLYLILELCGCICLVDIVWYNAVSEGTLWTWCGCGFCVPFRSYIYIHMLVGTVNGLVKYVRCMYLNDRTYVLCNILKLLSLAHQNWIKCYISAVKSLHQDIVR